MTVQALAPVLAHQGGWDEILLVLTPVSLFAVLLWLANRRANAQVASRREGDPDGRDDHPDPSDPPAPPDDPTS